MAAILLCGHSLTAQAQGETRHEVAVAIGGLSNSNWMNAFEDILDAPVSSAYDKRNSKYFGTISAEYFYHLNQTVAVGGIVGYGHRSYDLYSKDTDTFSGKSTSNYFTLMPSVKFNWVQGRHFGFYSKLAFGATLRTEKDSQIDYSKSKIHANWQASLLGLEAGGRSVRAFAELGVGEQGVLLGGVRYKF